MYIYIYIYIIIYILYITSVYVWQISMADMFCFSEAKTLSLNF